MRTASAISTGFRNGLSTWSISGSTRFGSRPSFPRRCGTLGTTSATTAPSTRFSARSPTSTRSLSPRTRAALRIILDFVPNHTSDQHPWFQESRSSKLHPKRDWYVWRDAKPDGSPPNNWESEFGGPAWTFDEVAGQYYYHAYLKEQPDLNWRNPDVEQAMCEVLRFWFDRGVDGFRVDAIHHLHEDEEDRDNPPEPQLAARNGTEDGAGCKSERSINRACTPRSERCDGLLTPMPDRVMIGEAYLPIDRLMAYYGADLTGFHLPFNFHLISTDWKPKPVASLIEAYEAALPVGAWPNWVLGNHDRSRVASRVGRAQARVAAMLLLTLRGTPTIYQGEEIGMVDTPIPPHLVQDPLERNVPGFGLGRDPVRTPMPWSPEPHGGFTEGRPWLPLHADADVLNVSTQADDPRSMLSLYRALIRLRRDSDVLSIGDLRLSGRDRARARLRTSARRSARGGRAQHDRASTVLAVRERALRKFCFRHISTIPVHRRTRRSTCAPTKVSSFVRRQMSPSRAQLGPLRTRIGVRT